MDNQLHPERIAKDRSKPLFEANLKELPNGVFVQRDVWGNNTYLVWDKELLEWTPAGYQTRLPRPRAGVVQVLTPKSMVEVIRAGYVPEIHRSALSD